MKKIRFGLIGCGSMMKSHLQNAGKVEGGEFVAFCDIIRERAEEVATITEGAFVTTDWRELADKVDAVLVALPHDLHYECGVFFARHKKHILMEKPLCNTEEECLDLIRICKEEGVVLMCGYPVPHYPAVRKLKELLDSGEYGKVMQMSVWTEQLTKHEEGHWLTTARMGGGQLFSHGCHYVDLLIRMLGTPVRGSHIGTTVGTPWLRREGTSALIMKFESGAVAYHGATWGARGSKMNWDIQIQTEKGMLEFEKLDGERIKFYSNIKPHEPGVVETSRHEVIWEINDRSLKQTYFEINHFIDCIRTGKKPISDGETALKSLQIIWELYKAEEGDYVADLSKYALTDEEAQVYDDYIRGFEQYEHQQP